MLAGVGDIEEVAPAATWKEGTAGALGEAGDGGEVTGDLGAMLQEGEEAGGGGAAAVEEEELCSGLVQP